MNILFFLTPKEDVAYINDDDNIRQVLEKMSFHRYSCIPVLSQDGKYSGSITEGDLLWGLKGIGLLSVSDAEDYSIEILPRERNYQPVTIETNIEDLIDKAMNQTYVPVVDDQNYFIGIITRRDIIQYCYKKMKSMEANK